MHIEIEGRYKTMKTRRKEILGELIRRERVIRRISQQTLADCCGLGKTAISAYELGKTSPPIETLDVICAYMGINYLDLLAEAQRIYNAERIAQ